MKYFLSIMFVVITIFFLLLLFVFPKIRNHQIENKLTGKYYTIDYKSSLEKCDTTDIPSIELYENNIIKINYRRNNIEGNWRVTGQDDYIGITIASFGHTIDIVANFFDEKPRLMFWNKDDYYNPCFKEIILERK